MDRSETFSSRPAADPAGADETAPASTNALLSQVEPALDKGAITLSSGRRIEAEMGADGDVIRVRAPGGTVVLTVLVTEAGPVLRFESAEIELAATRKVSVTCERFDVIASEGASLTTAGDLVEKIGGDATREVGGTAKIDAEDVSLAARHGNVDVRANDDVDVRGERIRLNCDDAPLPATWDEFLAKAQASALQHDAPSGPPRR